MQLLPQKSLERREDEEKATFAMRQKSEETLPFSGVDASIGSVMHSKPLNGILYKKGSFHRSDTESIAPKMVTTFAFYMQKDAGLFAVLLSHFLSVNNCIIEWYAIIVQRSNY